MDESRVKFGSDTLEQHTEEVLVGLQNSLPHGKSLHMAHTVGRAQCRHHRVGHGDGSLVGILQRHELAHLNVAAEAHHFVANRVLEAKNHAHRHNHHRQTNGHTCRSDANRRLRYHALSVALAVDSSCDEKWEVHILQ